MRLMMRGRCLVLAVAATPVGTLPDERECGTHSRVSRGIVFVLNDPTIRAGLPAALSKRKSKKEAKTVPQCSGVFVFAFPSQRLK